MAKTTRPKASAKGKSAVETAVVPEAVDDIAAESVPVEEAPIIDAEAMPEPPEPAPQDDPQVTESRPVEAAELDTANLPEPDAPKPEAAPEFVAATPSAEKRQGGFFGMVIGGMIAAAAGYGVATYFPLNAPAEDGSQIAALNAALEAQAKQIAALESAAPVEVDLSGLEGRVTALEQGGSAPVAVDLSPLAEKVTALEGRIVVLEADTGNANVGADADPALAATVDAMRKEIAALKGEGETAAANIQAMIAEADARVKAAEAEAARVQDEAEKAAQRAGNETALGRVQAAFEAGTPFADALGQITGAAIPEILTAHAEEGVPSLSLLAKEFPAAARNALDASRYATMGESVADRVTVFLENATGARSLAPREGDDPDAVLSRAEAQVKAGNLQAALDEIAQLPPEGVQAMEAWAALARTRVEADAAFAALKSAIAG